uniref:Uncharacterized protein n=2 Tax=Corethron hystrix TaxID=216773 RepID=A0A7S1FP48_9STRA|mmetsp:Transcript_19858/g.45100  ORF Transcript_19858/g.45100 Transcript_19858/m.45100 type:complete len:411 (+) Transcript_19858:184-1416(+)
MTDTDKSIQYPESSYNLRGRQKCCNFSDKSQSVKEITFDKDCETKERHLSFSDAHGNTHEVLLFVQQSNIPDAGEGLFLKLESNTTCKVPKNVVLGTYGPHRKEDVKSKHLFEIKNFVFNNMPHIYAWTNPNAEKGDLLFGKSIDKTSVIDVTRDDTGTLHYKAQECLLPKCNEIFKMIRGNASFKQSVVPHFDKDGYLQYKLKEGISLQPNEIIELLTDYGPEYQDIRERYKKTCNFIRRTPIIRNPIDINNCEHVKFTCIDIRRCITTLNEKSILEILIHFKKFKPDSSAARHRLYWFATEVHQYMRDLLYQRLQGEIPDFMLDAVRDVLALFSPKDNEEDKKRIEQHEWFGVAVHSNDIEGTARYGVIEECYHRCNKFKVVFGNGDIVHYDGEKIANMIVSNSYGVW